MAAVIIIYKTIALLRNAQGLLGDLDAVSQELVAGVLGNLEKDLWML